MNLQTFKASNMAEALAAVKSSLGSDAIILHTRTVQQRRWMGLRHSDVVEITAGKGMNVPRRGIGARSSAAAAHAPSAYRAASAGGGGVATAAAPRNALEGSRKLMETPAFNNAAMASISNEMTALKDMVKDLVKRTRQVDGPQVPEGLLDYYRTLIENQVAEELAGDIIRTLQLELRPEYHSNAEFVQSKLAEQLEKLLPSAGPICRTKMHGPHVVALIGPTGVGKTTTIAKLAANLKLRENKKVGLITLDTYRIAAVDQLKKYADIIGSTLKVVSNQDDLRTTIDEMSDCEFVLIDTAGRSPNDAMRLNELKGLLQVAQPDEVHLVLSATASQECVELAIQRFADVRVDKILFTKLDEAAHIGVVLNVVRKVNKKLSYITTGQDVPKDIEVSHGKRLARMILGEAV